MDYQLLLLCVATVWNSTWFSFRSMLHRKPMPESVTGVMFILATIYTAAICFLAPIPGNLYLFNFPVAFCALLHHFYRYMRIRREIMSFKIVSSKKPKYVIDALSAQDASLEMECFADYIPNDPLMFKIRRASFVKGFYERMDTYPRSYRILGILVHCCRILLRCLFHRSRIVHSGQHRISCVVFVYARGFIHFTCTSALSGSPRLLSARKRRDR